MPMGDFSDGANSGFNVGGNVKFKAPAVPVAETEIVFGRSGEGEVETPGFHSRFPFLAYDPRSDRVYLAFQDPVDESITVLWFLSSLPPGSSGGG